MEFRLDPDQVDLQATVARFFDDRFPLDSVVEREGAPLDRTTWRSLAELGIVGLLAHPERGGSGLGVLDAALVFEQIGSHLVPGPLLWSVLAAPIDAPALAGVAAGEVVVTGVETGAAPDPDADAGAEGLLVEAVADADVVLAASADSLTAHPVAGLVDVEPRTALDPLTTIASVGALGPGEAVGGADAAARLELVGTVLAAAELVGVASRALEVARAYALDRHQFGAPIGSFQAVKHLLADRYVATTLAQSATYAAAALVDRPGADDPGRSVAGAKLLAVDAALDGAATAIQVLGGMGFTWDMLPNHLLKRAWHVTHRFGTADDHAARLGVELVGATR